MKKKYTDLSTNKIECVPQLYMDMSSSAGALNVNEEIVVKK